MNRNLPAPVFINSLAVSDARVRRRESTSAKAAMLALSYAILLPILRPFGEIPLAIALSFCLLSVFYQGKLKVNKWHLLLSALCAVWLLLSFIDVLPSSWTVNFDAYAAIRHFFWVPISILFVAAYVSIWKFSIEFIVEKSALLVIGLSALTYLLSNIFSVGWDVVPFYSVNSWTISVYLLSCIFITLKCRGLWRVLGAVTLVAASSSSTYLVVSIYILSASIFGYPRVFAAALCSAVLAFLIAAPNYFLELSAIDSNMGVRAIMWRDVVVSFYETYGTGVGYGTEYIRNQFDELIYGWKLMPVYGQSGQLFISTHSSFYDVLLRNGISGAILLVLWVRSYFLEIKLSSNESLLFYSLIVLVVVAGSFNPGLVSVEMLIPLCLPLGLFELLIRKGRQVENSQLGSLI